jgi:hypothetical protein
MDLLSSPMVENISSEDPINDTRPISFQYTPSGREIIYKDELFNKHYLINYLQITDIY